MLLSDLNTHPPPKFILIQDSLQRSGEDLLNYFVNNNVKSLYNTNYYIFDGRFNVKSKKNISEHINYVDCTQSNVIYEEFESDLLKLKNGCCVVFSSLAHVAYLFGLARTYKLINSLLQKITTGQQIITLLHTDLLENNSKIAQCFEHLATLNILVSNSSQKINYTYKTSSGKVIQQIEEYSFTDGILKTKPIEKPDLTKMIQEKIEQILPENLSTFKIGLTEKDKESRDSLVLPYLPKESNESESNNDGNIYYQFEEVDDWDEEDPDDDLDL